MIRGKTKPCPFSLPITEGCKCVGNSVFAMKRITANSTKEEKEFNYQVFLTMDDEDKAPCPFADLIMDKKVAVDCKWNPETHQKMSGNAFVSGSPIYPNLYIGNSKSYQSYPIGNYGDDNIRTIYYGLVGLVD